MKLKNLFDKAKNEDSKFTLGRSLELPNFKKCQLFLIGLFSFFIFGSLISYAVESSHNFSEAEANGVITLSTYALLFLSLLSILGNNVLSFKKSFTNWRNYLLGFIMGLALIFIPLAYTNFVNLFYPININDNEKDLREFINIYPALSILIIGIVGPLCEELIYRVGLFGLLKKNKWVAYVIAVLIFAFMHFGFNSKDMVNEAINLPSYIISAIILTVTYDKFDLSASFTAHAMNNLFAVISFIIISRM